MTNQNQPKRRRRPRLISNWRDIIKHAWSLRFGLLAAVLSAVEVIVPLFQDSFPRGIFAALTGISVIAAMVARLIGQKDMP